MTHQQMKTTSTPHKTQPHHDDTMAPVYEQLGAPSLLYRNSSCYTIQREAWDIAEDVKYLEHIAPHHRAQARWYYPSLVVKDDDYEQQQKQKQTSRRDKNKNGADFSCPNAGTSKQGEDRLRPKLLDPSTNLPKNGDLLSLDCISERFIRRHSLVTPQRTEMLLYNIDKNDKSLVLERKRKLRNYQHFDSNYVKLGVVRTRNDSNSSSATQLAPETFQKSRLCAMERRNCSDPAYLAPLVDGVCLEPKVKDPRTRRNQVKRNDRSYHVIQPTCERQEYGNTMVAFQCPCPSCGTMSFRLLHVTGPLLEIVRLSRLRFPRQNDDHDKDDSSIFELNVGDAIRQIVQCGRLEFVARTRTSCVMFGVRMKPGDSPSCRMDGLFEIRRIDLRSMHRAVPSLLPKDVACHARYGNDFVPPKVAILFKSDHGRRNIIHQVTTTTSRSTSHTILNLQDISCIDFSSEHPQVLWSAAKSFVRPALKGGFERTIPRVGHGHSLFSVDLRSEKGTFQWSPSSQEYMTEGTHSLSAVCTDWNKPHTLFASSFSAGKTYEIDTRMPFRAVTSWSLPFSCDGVPTTQPVSALYGSGTIFAQPLSSSSEDHRPILAVDLSVGANGIHLYQRPINPPRFQTKSLECASCAGLASMKDLSVATSSYFVLPDVSDSVFTCGLAVLRAPILDFLSIDDLASLGFLNKEAESVLCAITMTNQGDLYAHSLVESSKMAVRVSQSYPETPVGSRLLHVPNNTVATANTITKPNDLRLNLSNDFPIPSPAMAPPPAPTTNQTDIQMSALPRAKVEFGTGIQLNDQTSVPVSRMQRLLASVDGGQQDRVERLPVSIATSSASAELRLKATLDCFAKNETNGDDNSEQRSDLNHTVLQQMDAKWPSLSSDESSEEEEDDSDDNASL